MKLRLLPVLLFLSQIVFSQGNPIVRDIYTADPSAHVWADGRLYVYPSHDIAPPRGCDFMDKYHVYSTDDMVHWTDHGQILEAKDVPWSEPLSDGSTLMWAPDCAYKNGKYYYYFPHPNKDPWGQNWKIGIAVSDKPASDFVCLDHWLIGLPDNGEIDPCVFIDDDGQAYFYYGGGGRCYGAKLKDNMIELDGELQRMLLTSGSNIYDFHEGTWVFKRNGIYYLTYADGNSGANNQLRYAISSNPLGPWTYKGVYLKPQTAETSHGSVVEYKGQWWAFYHTADLSGNGALRSICVDKLFFNADGTIQTVVQTKDMGSPYLDVTKTTNDEIQAEDYNSGGKGIAYWSNNKTNTGDLRLKENIIIKFIRAKQMYYVTGTSYSSTSSIATREYINYTFEVLEDGVYDIDFTIGSPLNAGTQFYVDFDWFKNSNPRIYLAPYASVSDLQVVTVPEVTLTKGIHTMNFYPMGNVYFDKFSFRNYASIKKVNAEGIEVYPNPSDGLFQVSAPTMGTISVNDSSGKCILKEKMKDNKSTIDLSGYASGVYILTIKSGDHISQRKLIKK